MKCPWYYEWVKLPRKLIPAGKGVMGDYIRLASRAAFRKGISVYCGFENCVVPGMWAGGIVGVKSILGVKSRNKAFEALDRLSSLHYINYELNEENKKLQYQITDWVVQCSGADCMKKGAVYTTQGYGFLCIPRNITERLEKDNYIFEEADAWLDLWCHTVVNDPNNAFSLMAPAVQYGKYGAILTLETLGQRWGWEKTKVWRFFKKHGDVFALYRLSSSYGCLIFNKCYPCDDEVSLPMQEDIKELIDKIRDYSRDITKMGTEHEHLSQMVAWYSRKLTGSQESIENKKDSDCKGRETDGCGECTSPECRIALSSPIIYAYFSLCRNCKKYTDCGKENDIAVREDKEIRGPCIRLDSIRKERFLYEPAD
ncbi:MAG: hypothetical protein IJ801_01180 [Lachnospiraceae bacterium]|nr:hypothetical protein [Lachnospiraceae bacterium]